MFKLCLVARVDKDGNQVRNRCAMCVTLIAFLCTGWKRHLCANKSDDGRMKKIEKKLGLEEDPQKFIKISQINPFHNDPMHREKIRGRDSCYLIAHEHAMGEYWAAQNTNTNVIQNLMKTLQLAGRSKGKK